MLGKATKPSLLNEVKRYGTMASSATYEIAKIKVDEFVQEYGIDEHTREEVLKRFGEIGLECLITYYEV